MPKPNGELTYDEAERMVQIGLDPNEYRSAKGSGGRVIEGYLAVWDVFARIGGKSGFDEVLRRGCFTKSLKDGGDIICTFNHNSNKILGRKSNGTLELHEDSKGLAFRCKLPAGVSYADDVYNLIESRTVSACSFQGIWLKDQFNAQYTKREVFEVDLIEAGCVSLPAYKETSVFISRDAPHEQGNAKRCADYVSEIDTITRSVFPTNRKRSMEDMEIMRNAESLIKCMPESSDLRMRICERADGARYESVELRNLLRKHSCHSLAELRGKMHESAEIRSAFEALAVRAEMLAKGEAV
jgi:hypothetical protein